MAIRPADQQQSYRDLRARSNRKDRSRAEQLQRIVGLHRERHLHAFRTGTVAVLWHVNGNDGERGEIGLAA